MRLRGGCANLMLEVAMVAGCVLAWCCGNGGADPRQWLEMMAQGADSFPVCEKIKLSRVCNGARLARLRSCWNGEGAWKKMLGGRRCD